MFLFRLCRHVTTQSILVVCRVVCAKVVGAISSEGVRRSSLKPLGMQASIFAACPNPG